MPTQPSWYNASLLAVEEEETEGLQVCLDGDDGDDGDGDDGDRNW